MPASTEVTILIVDDHPLVREGLRALLRDESGLRILAEAGTGEEAIELVDELQPDLVLMDIRLPGISGIEATRWIKRVHPDTAVVLLTMYDSEMYVMEGLRAGAAGYLVKDCSRELLREATRAALGGGVIMTQRVFCHFVGAPGRGYLPAVDENTLRKRLTGREVEVLRLVARGCPNKAIAQELHLAEVTVKKHVQNIIGKMETANRTQAAVVAATYGLAK